PAAHDHRPSAFFHHRDQGHVIDKVDVREECDFLLAKAASYRKEPAADGAAACAADSFDESAPIVGFDGADFDAASVPQRLNCRIPACFRHGLHTSDHRHKVCGGRGLGECPGARTT